MDFEEYKANREEINKKIREAVKNHKIDHYDWDISPEENKQTLQELSITQAKLSDSAPIQSEKIARKDLGDDEIELSASQQKAIDGLYNAFTFEEKDKDFFVDVKQKQQIALLNGYAGTGKTTSVKFLVKKILQNHKTATIGITAPTNKATSVIAQSVLYDGIDFNRLQFSTVQSYMALTVKTRKDKQILVRDDTKQPIKSDLLIVDEASMIDDELYGYIINSENPNILFVGDKCQIRPVNKPITGISKSFEPKIHEFNLTQIIRQAEHNPLIEQSILFREAQTDKNLEVYVKPNLVQGEGVHIISANKAVITFCEQFKEESDPANLKILAFKNKTVHEVNQCVRRTLFGDVDEYIEGEMLVAQTPRSTYNTGAEFIIDKCEKKFDDYYQLEYFDIVVKTPQGKQHELKVLTYQAKAKHLESLNRLALLAHNDKEVWNQYWALRLNYDDLAHWYCMTTHKAQGSTYKNVFIIYDDFTLREREQKFQLLYTAITRASSNAYFCTGNFDANDYAKVQKGEKPDIETPREGFKF